MSLQITLGMPSENGEYSIGNFKIDGKRQVSIVRKLHDCYNLSAQQMTDDEVLEWIKGLLERSEKCIKIVLT